VTAALLSGFALGLSLIVAIGAQNLFVLRQGIRREHVLVVALLCTVSDAALIIVGVSGAGWVLHSVPWLVDVVRWAGAAFLLGYAALAARRAWRPTGAALDAHAAPAGVPANGPGTRTVTAGATTLPAVVATCLALTWLNPHVYLDTVFLLGTVAATQGADRWWFAAGAVVASTAWFLSLAYGSRYLGRWLATPRAWRVLDGAIAVVMTAVAISLVLPA